MKTQIELDTFTKAYIVCALWSSMDNSDEQGGDPLDANYDIDDIAPETLEKMIADCQDFQKAQADLLAQAGTDEQNGHDFWLNRNGHGAGFWDRGYGELGRKLSDACRPYGSCDIYVGDDGKLYI